MTPSRILTITALLWGFTSFSAAAPALPKSNKTAITPANVEKIRKVAEVDKWAYRIFHGPNAGEMILHGRTDGIEVFDVVNLKTERKLLKEVKPVGFAISNDGKYVMWIERNKTIYTVQDLTTNKTFEINAGASPGEAPAFSLDNKLIAICDTVVTPIDPEGGGYSVMNLYDFTGKLVRSFDKVDQGSLRPVFHKDGKIMAVGHRNRATQLVEIETGKVLHTLDKRMTHEIAFSPDGKTLAATYVDGTVALWEVATGKLIKSEASGCREAIALDWSPKGDLLVTAGMQGKLVFWDPTKLTKLKEVDALSAMYSVRFTADGSQLIGSGASNQSIKGERKTIVWAVPQEIK
jgi:WD40 repeat protein